MFPYIQFGPIAISTYFLLISSAATAAGLWFIQRMESRGFLRVVAIDLTLIILLSAFFGARGFHVLYEEPAFYAENPMEILQVWNGGFVYFGGVLGGLLGMMLYCAKMRVPLLVTMDMAALPLSLAYVIGRVGCFLNGCCYGRICELPWAMNLQGEHRHPTQLYASVMEVVIFGVLFKSESRLRDPGQLAGLWLILHSAARLVMEHFRDDPRGEFILGLSVSTWLSIAFICVGLGLVWPKSNPAAPELQS